ncbi:DUF1571 domain-containing protein [Hymenobacter sp. BRD128]|uniref:LysM peptidoglycan-binding domain-containing protein n=1 Tax=Hymenobacter sp. BRD128 TaxID=2675878 RepID=UPI0020B7DCFC|nr:DUF1571 domain-containing protein [Hymenobacter sp. BRD128]
MLLRVIFTCLLAGNVLIRAATPIPTAAITTAQLTARLITAIKTLKSLRCNADARERISDKLVADYTAMKITFNPYRVYLKNRKSVEVLYVTGQNNNKAWVYPAAFPYITLNLDPNGSLMRKGQHHTALQAGFGMIADLLAGPTGRGDNAFTRSFRYAGDTTAQGQPGYILRSDYPQFRYIAYRVGKNETIASIAAHFSCGEYRILERNNLRVDSGLTEGQVLQVPNAYGRRVIVVVDAKTYLPASVTAYDDQGLYEKYSFLNVVANQPISPVEFSTDYKGYKL